MKVLTIVPNLGYRGTQRVAQNYTVALANRGHEVGVLAFNEGGFRGELLLQKGIKVWIGENHLQQTLNEVRTFKPDVIHIHRQGMHDSKWGSILRELKRPGGCILETSVFGRVDYSDDASMIDVHLQISKWCLYRWRRWLGLRKQIGVYLPNAVDMEKFPAMDAEARKASRQTFNLPAASFVCGRIGKWSPCIFEAFTALIQRCPDALLLNVLDHPDAHDYAVCLPAKVRERIVSVPQLQDDAALVCFYGSLDCLLQVAPAGESFGLVLAEAMACGTPVVTASIPHKDNAQVEVVKHKVGGIVAGSTSKLSEALITFYEDRTLQKTCSSQSRTLISERYDLKDIVEKIEIIARHVLDSGSRQEMARRLSADSSIVMDIPRNEIMESIYNTLGGPSVAELMLMRIVHNPVIFRYYSRLKYGF
jgi:glycosyltransferase involved in cell wall biosynthesis